MRTVSLVVVAILLALVSAAWADNHVMMDPKELKWEDNAALPGAKVAVLEGPLDQPGPFIIRFKFPANYKVPAHWHPNIEHVTVLSGTLYMGTGDKLDMAKGHPIATGGVAIMPAKTNHFGWTTEETVVQVHGVGPWGVTFVDPADDPRKK